MATKRTSKTITKEEDINYLLDLDYETLTSLSFIMEVFGEFGDKRRFNPYDTVTIPADSYGTEQTKNKKPFTTTVGLWIFNKVFIEPEMFEVFHYINETITKSKFGYINSEMSYAIIEDKLDLDALKKFIMRCQKFQPYVHILSPNHTMNMLLITELINKKKKELLDLHKDALANKDEKVIGAIEIELLNYAREVLKDDPSMDMYLSGAKSSFDNNFKNLFVMRGAIKNPDPNKGYDIITSSYMDGISKEEYATFSNSLAAGPYAKAKKTEVGGYWEKLYLQALSHIKLDVPGSDCGTTNYITTTITKKKVGDVMYNYIVEGSRLVCLTSENKDKYIGKTVKMRFSSMCESKTGICNKCAGDLFYKLNLTNVGTMTPQMPSKLKTISMKSFHDSSVRFAEMDVMKAFGY